MKNKILKGLAMINGISFIFFGCMLDSASLLPVAICLINLGYIALFGYANDWFADERWLD